MKARPNFKTLGSRAGKLMGRLAEAIKNFDSEQIRSFLENGYEHVLIDGHEFRLEREDAEILSQAKEHYVSVSDRHITVALNTELNEELLEEGFAREFVNRVQNMRKEAGFDVTDRIAIQVEGLAESAAKAVLHQKDYIGTETLADAIEFTHPTDGFKKEIKIDDKQFIIGLKQTK
jgi:isoleucyl-tRNA synthetase